MYSINIFTVTIFGFKNLNVVVKVFSESKITSFHIGSYRTGGLFVTTAITT